MESKRIVIFSGTTEGRILSQKLSKLAVTGLEILVSVATEYGETVQGQMDGVKVIHGRKTKEEKMQLLKGAMACVDATHPYATKITGHIKEACQEVGTEYIRLMRAKSQASDDLMPFESVDRAAEYLKGQEGNILVTTGAKELKSFARCGSHRIYPRVLPLISSLLEVEETGVPMKNVIAMQGPFSEELNIALMKEHDIRFMVTKDGGKAGGFDEKIKAAEKCGVKVLLVERPDDNGMDAHKVFEYLRGRLTWQ